MGVLAHACNLSTWKVEAGESDQDLRPLSRNKQRKSRIYMYNFVHEELYPRPDFEAGLPCVLTDTELTTYIKLAWSFPFFSPKGAKITGVSHPQRVSSLFSDSGQDTSNSWAQTILPLPPESPARAPDSQDFFLANELQRLSICSHLSSTRIHSARKQGHPQRPSLP